MERDFTLDVLAAARDASLAADAPLLLAVSGGLDSMVLLHAMAEAAHARVAAVATFDHGSGPAASAAAAHVARAAIALRLPVVTGHADGTRSRGDGREAAWRDARYRFLRSAASQLNARVATAHTEDDQVETVLMRVLRGSGARGLAGLYAASDIVRPFLGLRRAVLERFARDRGIRWRDDPSNTSREFLRNRVRLDLLPALCRVRPMLEEELLAVARRSAEWRHEIDRIVTEVTRPTVDKAGAVSVAAKELAGFDADSLCVIWSSLAGRIGLALDRRGTRRLAAFTMNVPRSGAMPLSGGWYMEARRGVYILGKRPGQDRAALPMPTTGMLEWGSFRFRVEEAATNAVAPSHAEPWGGPNVAGAPVLVRAWGPGDRLGPSGGQGRRRVKRYLSEMGVRGLERDGWPVVVGEGGDVVWIPGVRRADAATERSGRPVRHYVCERITR